MKCDLVCEGGGTKIGGLVGGIKSLEDKGFEFVNMAGASAGAIVTSLKAAGYSAAELENLILQLDFKSFLDGSKFLTAYNWIANQGLYKGDAFYHFMKRLLCRCVFVVLSFGALPWKDSCFKLNRCSHLR